MDNVDEFEEKLEATERVLNQKTLDLSEALQKLTNIDDKVKEEQIRRLE